MKKIVSILLVCVFMLSLTMVPASSESSFRGWFYSEYIKQYGTPTHYTECYYHYQDSENFDSSNIAWALILCTEEVMDDFVDNRHYCVVGDRVIVEPADMWPYAIPYAVYDKEKNEFTNIVDVDYNNYEGLLEALDNEKFVYMIGDMDSDKKLSIIDSTMIQQALVGMIEFPENDENVAWCVQGSEKLDYFSDVDRDGERTVMDATVIQMKLAQLDS